MKSVLVWDWPIRVSHWLMAFLFTGLIVTGKLQGDLFQYHFYLGYGLSSVIVFRLLYGLYGSKYAKFSQFLKGPKAVFSFMKSMLNGESRVYLGHNPAGGWMVVILLLTLTFQWVSGLFTSDDIFWFGPLNQYASNDWIGQMSWIHHALPNILLALVGLHIAAVLYHELCLKERLTLAMITGKKRTDIASNFNIKTPRWGVIFSMIIGFSWLIWLWTLPV